MTHASIAIVRPPPSSFTQCVTEFEGPEPIQLELALSQWLNYVKALQQHVSKLIQLPPLESHPDSCFVEDTTVVIGRRALINQFGHPTRRGEVGAVKEALEQCGLEVTTMSQGEATLDGGDVLWTGRHLMVGRSRRTNDEGIAQLKDVFMNEKVIAVPVPSDVLHFKCLLSAWDSKTLVISDEPAGRQVWQAITKALGEEEKYDVVWVPDRIAANVLSFPADRFVMVQESAPDSCRIFNEEAKKRGWEVQALNMSENIKADGALTCLSILLHHEHI